MSGNRTTKWERVDQVSSVETALSFAVGLVDGATGGRPTGDVTVSLTNAPVEPVVNPSGFRLFLDVETAFDPATVVVDGGDRYRDETVTVHFDTEPPQGSTAVDATDPSDPVEVTLTPTPAYPFAPGTTLLRGFVTDVPMNDGEIPDGAGVGGATVSVAGFPVSNESVEATTVASGEYVLALPVSGERVVRGPDERWLTEPGASGGSPGNGNGNGDQFDPPTHEVTVNHPSYSEDTVEIPLRAGGVTKHHVVLQ